MSSAYTSKIFLSFKKCTTAGGGGRGRLLCARHDAKCFNVLSSSILLISL